MVGGQRLASGNMLIRTRKVSWIQSNLGFSDTLTPSAESMDTQHRAVAISGLGFQLINVDGVTNGHGDFSGSGLVATSILSPRQSQ